MVYSVVPLFGKNKCASGNKTTAFGFLQSKEEVMAVRLREADKIAAMAELQQQISELEIQVGIVFLNEITV